MSANIAQLFISALILISATGSSISFAESTKPVVKKSVTTITTVETEGEDETPAPTDSPTQVTDDNELTTVFGSTATTGLAGCKTEELTKSVIRDLKSDCSAWMKDQKSQLKDKYLTGTCEEQCSDCQMGLRRCSVKGSVRYSKSTIRK